MIQFQTITGAVIAVSIILAVHSPTQAATPATETDVLYSAPGGMLTLVAGAGDPGPDVRQPEVLRFTDDQGALVRVYADHAVGIAEGRAALAKCRKAKAHAAEVRRELAARGR